MHVFVHCVYVYAFVLVYVCVCLSANFFCKQAMIVSLLTVEHINLCSGYCRGGNDLCPNRQSQRE